MPLFRTLTRLLVAWVFFRGGIDVLRNPQPRANTARWFFEHVRRYVPLPDDIEDVALVRANAAVQVSAASLLILGRRTRLAALTLAAVLVPTTIGGHPFWRLTEPGQRAQQQIHFNKNLAILGGLLLTAMNASERRSRIT